MSALPPYVSRDAVADRLPRIFPEGTAGRNYCVRELAASTVFTALYIGAVEGGERYFGPKHVYRMTVEQAAKSGDDDRLGYDAEIRRRGGGIEGTRWYADNTREPIRDETLRDGLMLVGAVVARQGIATTSGAPRYALGRDFAALFDPALQGDVLDEAIRRFHERHLSKGALTRIAIMRAGAAVGADGMLVTFPSGETRQLSPGRSSLIARAVVEVFAPRFLQHPAVLWLSESVAKVAHRDDRIAASIGLKIEADRNLPDMILADIAPDETLLVFVEVVATDGAVTERRRAAIFELTDAAGFQRQEVAFVTAFEDRQSSGFKKTVPQIAWGSFAWFMSEPNQLCVFEEGGDYPTLLSKRVKGAKQ